MSKVKIIHTPPRQRGREPKPPAWWRTFWRPTGTVVEYLGVRWELDVVGAADQSWRQWVRVTPTNHTDGDEKRLCFLGGKPGEALCPNCRGEITSWFCERCGNTGKVTG